MHLLANDINFIIRCRLLGVKCYILRNDTCIPSSRLHFLQCLIIHKQSCGHLFCHFGTSIVSTCSTFCHIDASEVHRVRAIINCHTLRDIEVVNSSSRIGNFHHILNCCTLHFYFPVNIFGSSIKGGLYNRNCFFFSSSSINGVCAKV